MALEIVNFVKNTNGGIGAMSIENALYHLNTPKFVVSIVSPTNEQQLKRIAEAQCKNGMHDNGHPKSYIAAHAFLDVNEAVLLMRRIRSSFAEDLENVFDSYKGGVDERYNNQVISRVFHVKRNRDRNTFIFVVEIMEGEQSFVINKNGEKVPGIVKPKRGGKSYIRNSFSLSREEVLYCVDMIGYELTAWRTILNWRFSGDPKSFRR